MTVRDLFEDFLRDSGALTPLRLGSSQTATDRPPGATSAQVSRLEERLRLYARGNNRLSISIIVMYWIIFFIAVAFVVRAEGQNVRLAAILGSGASLMAVAARLSKLWKEKVLVGATLAVLPDLPPEEGTKVILALYYEEARDTLSRSSKGHRRGNAKNANHRVET